MNRNDYLIGIASMPLLLMLPHFHCEAGSPQQRATAAVAIARAALEIADERPRLNDAPRNEPRQRNGSDVESASVEKPKHRPASTEHPVTESAVTGRDGRSLPSIHFDPGPMRIELAETTIVSDILPAQLVIRGWESGCPTCVRLEREVKSILGPLGWRIGNDSSDQIQFVRVPQSEPVPQITLYQNGTVLQVWTQYVDTGLLSQTLRKSWDEAVRAGPPVGTATASGLAGGIHAQPQIRAALSWWREHIGEHITGSISWDRTGAQIFPLLASGDWSTIALFGRAGRFEMTARGAKGIPVDQLGFGYRVLGDDISLDLDPVTIKGLAIKLGPTSQAMSTVPSQVDPMTAWTIFTILHDLWSMLHPTCDLQLGGNVSATAILEGDTLSVDFRQCPSIKLVALFTFQLNVQRVEITETSVRVLFSGSRLIKERMFQVK